MTAVDRIGQFEKMASADPTNEMAHFSLGGAYAEAGRHAEAAKAYERCIELVPHMSRAYELCGQSMVAAGWADRAVKVLLAGYEIAAERGDRKPQEAIAVLLRSLGREPPTIEPKRNAAAAPAGAGGFMCQRTGRAGTQLERPPFKGPIGAWIHENISAETWKTWIGQGTKVINELRLDFSREQDQKTYDEHMHEFLGIDAALLEKLGSRS